MRFLDDVVKSNYGKIIFKKDGSKKYIAKKSIKPIILVQDLIKRIELALPKWMSNYKVKLSWYSKDNYLKINTLKANGRESLNSLFQAYKIIKEIAKKKKVDYVTANFKNKRLAKIMKRYGWKHKKSNIYTKKINE